MRIVSASLVDFRNIARADLRFSSDLTALVGPNGQGKTNLLEALYYVAALRPLRNAQRHDLLRSGAGKSEIKVQMRAYRTGLVHDLVVELSGKHRRLEKDGKSCDARSFLGQLVAVAFTPDDLALTKGGPELRRRFLDRAVLNTQPAYLDAALRYARALKARNRVLQTRGPDDLLEAYDAILASEGAEIIWARRDLLRDLAPAIREAFSEIAHPAPDLALRYLSSSDLPPTEDRGALRSSLLEALTEARPRDRQRHQTSVGPHRDELEIRLGSGSSRSRASQGQHRALVLAMKLAEIRRLAERLEEPPILLLDDISSELDSRRAGQLFEAVRALEVQVVLTTTDPTQIPARAESEVLAYRVLQGAFSPRSLDELRGAEAPRDGDTPGVPG